MKRGLATKTIILLALAVIASAAILSFFIPRLWGKDVKDMLPMKNPTEMLRFMSYIRCSIAACTGGCNSGETIVTNVIDNDGERMSCNQLLIGEGICTSSNKEKRCDSSYHLDFIFKEEIVYRSDYDVDRNDKTTYEGTPCSISKDNGWNTELSCRGDPSGLYPCPCERCLRYLKHVPYGVLFDSGSSCDSGPGNEHFLGSLWLPNSFVQVNCIDNGQLGSLKSCTFPETTRIRIWADDITQAGTCGLVGLCVGVSNNCPRIVICPT